MKKQKLLDIPEKITSGEVFYEKFIPAPLHQFRENYTKMTIRKRIRFLLQSIKGSVIYYMKINNQVVGYVVLEMGGGVRYPFTKKNDWIISPYVINPLERGKGYGTRLLNDLKNNIHPHLKGYIWAEVRVGNIASIKAMEKANYEFISYAAIQGVFRTYVMKSEKSEYMMFRI